MQGECWLIGESGGRWLPGFEAAARGLPVRGCRYGAVAEIPDKPGVVIALDWSFFPADAGTIPVFVGSEPGTWPSP